MIQRALASGASVNTTASLTLKMGEPHKGSRKGAPLHVTPLMRACEQGNQDIVRLLLDSQANINSCDSHGWSPLCHALGSGEVDIALDLVAQQQDRHKLQLQRDALLGKLRPEVLARCERELGKDVAM